MDEKSTASEQQASAATQGQGASEHGGGRGKRRVKMQRRFELEDLPRDEDGKVILPDDITYPEFIRLTHPEMTDAQVDKAVRKEHRNVMIVRAELICFAVLIVLIIILIATS